MNNKSLIGIVALGVIIVALVFAVPVLAYTYHAQIQASENGTASYNMLPVIMPAQNSWMASNGFMKSSGNDTRIETLAGSEKPHMVTNNMTLFAIPVAQNSQNNLYYSMGNSQLSSFPIIVGKDGYITTNYTSALDFGENFTVEIGGAYVNTTQVGGVLAQKSNAYCTNITASGNITSAILTGYTAWNTWNSFSNNTTTTNFNLDGATKTALGQVIQGVSDNTCITSAVFKLQKSGSPTGTGYARVKNVSDNATLGTLGSIDISTISTSVTGYTFNSANITVPTARDIRVIFECPVNASNYIMGFYSANVIANQSFCSYNSTVGAWDNWTAANVDCAYTVVYYTNPKNKESTLAFVTASGVSSGEHTIITDKQTPFMAIGVDNTTALLPVSSNIVLNAPLWQSDLSGSTFTSIDAYAHSCNVSGATWSSSGRSFDGVDDYISVPDSPSLDITEALSIEVWCYPDSPASTLVLTSKQYLLQLWTGTSKWNARVRDTTPSNKEVINAGAVSSAHTHLVFAVNGTTGKVSLYQNGVSIGSQDYSPFTMETNNLAFYLGAFNDGVAPSLFWDGLIGEVRIYNRALSASEVLQNYNATKWKYTGDNTRALYSTLASVPNNSNNILWNSTNAFAYADNLSISTNGTMRLWYQPTAMITGRTLIDRQGTKNGDITWGSNPAGVTVSLASLTALSQPELGAEVTTATPDILPTVGVSNWYKAPDITGSLATHPLRPFVQILSSSGSMSERQAWTFLGLVFVLMVTVGTAVALRGHLLIAGIACCVAIVALVAQTIFPLWSLIFAGMSVLVGILAERTPSV